MTNRILTRLMKDVTHLLAPANSTAQKTTETVQIVTIPKTPGEVTP